MARTFEANIVLNLIDRLSGGLARANRDVNHHLTAMEKSFHKFSKVALSFTPMVAGLNLVTRALHTVAEQMREISKIQNDIAKSSVRAQRDATGAVVAITSIKPEQIIADRRKAMELSKEYGLLVQQILHEQEQLTKAGLSPEAARGASGPAALLAKTQDIENTEAMTRAMVVMARSFQLATGTADQAKASFSDMGDIMAEAATKGVKVEELVQTMRFAAPLLGGTGMNFSQAMQVAVQMAAGGYYSSESGVALRSMMVNIMKPKKSALELFAQKGIDREKFVQTVPLTTQGLERALMGQFADLQPIPEKDLQEAVKTSDIAQRRQRVIELVRQRSKDAREMTAPSFEEAINEALRGSTTRVDLPGFLKELREKGVTEQDLPKIFEGRQTPRIIALMDRVLSAAPLSTPQGFMKKQLEEQQKGLDGALKNFEASMSQLAAAFSDSAPMKMVVIPAINALASAVSTLASAFEHASPATQNFVTAIGMLAGTALAVGASTAAIRGLVKIFAPALLAAEAGAGAAAPAAGAAGAAAAVAAGAGRTGLLATGGRLLLRTAPLAVAAAVLSQLASGYPEEYDPDDPSTHGVAGYHRRRKLAEYKAKQRALTDDRAESRAQQTEALRYQLTREQRLRLGLDRPPAMAPNDRGGSIDRDLKWAGKPSLKPYGYPDLPLGSEMAGGWPEGVTADMFKEANDNTTEAIEKTSKAVDQVATSAPQSVQTGALGALQAFFGMDGKGVIAALQQAITAAAGGGAGGGGGGGGGDGGGGGGGGGGGDGGAGAGPLHPGNVRPEFKQRVDAFRAFLKARGIPTRINSGYRTFAEQQRLYNRYLHGGPLAAPPGRSRHERGEAVDMSPLSMRESDRIFMARHAPQFGIEAGYFWRHRDRPHFQMNRGWRGSLPGGEQGRLDVHVHDDRISAKGSGRAPIPVRAHHKGRRMAEVGAHPSRRDE